MVLALPELTLEPALRAREIAVLSGRGFALWRGVLRLERPSFFVTPGADLHKAHGVLVLLGPPFSLQVAQEGIWLARQQGLPLTLAWIEEAEEPGGLEGPYFSPCLWQATRRRAWQKLGGPLEEARQAGVRVRGGLYHSQDFLREARRQGLVVLGLPQRGLRWGRASQVYSLLKKGVLGVLVVIA